MACLGSEHVGGETSGERSVQKKPFFGSIGPLVSASLCCDDWFAQQGTKMVHSACFLGIRRENETAKGRTFQTRSSFLMLFDHE